jgi:hypothetical protein
VAQQQHADQRALHTLTGREGQRRVQVDGRADHDQQGLRMTGQMRFEVVKVLDDVEAVEPAERGAPLNSRFDVDVVGHGLRRRLRNR